jgi:hypothetical protein
VTALKLRRQQQDTAREQAGDLCADTGLVFSTRFGTPIEPRNFTRRFDRRITEARVRRITVHGTHKSCGSLLAALDVHPRVAMQILRHSKIAITMEIYTEVVSGDPRSAPQARRPARPLRRLLRFAAPPQPKRPHPDRIEPLIWSPVTESNRRPSPYHGDALPTELTGPVSTADGDELTVLLASRCLLHGSRLHQPTTAAPGAATTQGNRTPSAI